MRILTKKSLTALVGASALALSAQGADLNIVQRGSSGSLSQVFSADITNDTGVALDSASLDYSQVFSDTANLAWNIGTYDGQNGGTVDGIVTLSEFLPQAKTDGDIFFGIDNTGDVYTGWNSSIGNDGIVDLTKGGFAEDWNTTETMDTFLGIDNSLFLNPSTNTIVPISLDPSQTITDFASGSAGTQTVPFTADGLGYEVVPEVSFYGLLLGAVSLGWAVSKRRR